MCTIFSFILPVKSMEQQNRKFEYAASSTVVLEPSNSLFTEDDIPRQEVRSFTLLDSKNSKQIDKASQTISDNSLPAQKSMIPPDSMIQLICTVDRDSIKKIYTEMQQAQSDANQKQLQLILILKSRNEEEEEQERRVSSVLFNVDNKNIDIQTQDNDEYETSNVMLKNLENNEILQIQEKNCDTFLPAVQENIIQNNDAVQIIATPTPQQKTKRHKKHVETIVVGTDINGHEIQIPKQYIKKILTDDIFKGALQVLADEDRMYIFFNNLVEQKMKNNKYRPINIIDRKKIIKSLRKSPFIRHSECYLDTASEVMSGTIDQWKNTKLSMTSIKYMQILAAKAKDILLKKSNSITDDDLIILTKYIFCMMSRNLNKYHISIQKSFAHNKIKYNTQDYAALCIRMLSITYPELVNHPHLIQLMKELCIVLAQSEMPNIKRVATTQNRSLATQSQSSLGNTLAALGSGTATAIGGMLTLENLSDMTDLFGSIFGAIISGS